METEIQNRESLYSYPLKTRRTDRKHRKGRKQGSKRTGHVDRRLQGMQVSDSWEKEKIHSGKFYKLV